MYAAKTTFVIGAGASLELGFPTSVSLKDQIAKSVNIGFEHGSRLVRGDRHIAEALRKFSDYQNGQAEEYNKYLHSGWHVGQAMPQAISIDNFIDNQEDDYVTAISKLGIASCIIDAEEKCFKEFKARGHDNKIDWEKFQQTWIHQLFQTINEGRKKSNISMIFENLQFIVFNYDRSLEYYLARAIENYYSVPAKEAEEIVASACFVHPYGQVGRLPWQTSNLPSMAFGSGEKYHLYEISNSILTFSEQVEDEDALTTLRGAVSDATQIIFLGFAFHPSNMQLLRPERKTDTSRVVATAYGISASDCTIIQDELKNVCFVDNAAKTEKIGKFVIDSSAKCSELFQRYRKTIVS